MVAVSGSTRHRATRPTPRLGAHPTAWRMDHPGFQEDGARLDDARNVGRDPPTTNLPAVNPPVQLAWQPPLRARPVISSPELVIPARTILPVAADALSPFLTQNSNQ